MARTLRHAKGRQFENMQRTAATNRGDDATTTDDRDTDRRADDVYNTSDERRIEEESLDRAEQIDKEAEARDENEGSGAAS